MFTGYIAWVAVLGLFTTILLEFGKADSSAVRRPTTLIEVGDAVLMEIKNNGSVPPALVVPVAKFATAHGCRP